MKSHINVVFSVLVGFFLSSNAFAHGLHPNLIVSSDIQHLLTHILYLAPFAIIFMVYQKIKKTK